jgi:hypothetical protein
MTPDQARLLVEIEAAVEGSGALDERIAFLLDLPPPALTVADCGTVILDDDRKFTRSLTATRRLLPEAIRWSIDNDGSNTPVGASVEHVVASRHASDGARRTAELAFSIATLRWLWGETSMAEARDSTRSRDRAARLVSRPRAAAAPSRIPAVAVSD